MRGVAHMKRRWRACATPVGTTDISLRLSGSAREIDFTPTSSSVNVMGRFPRKSESTMYRLITQGDTKICGQAVQS